MAHSQRLVIGLIALLAAACGAPAIASPTQNLAGSPTTSAPSPQGAPSPSAETPDDPRRLDLAYLVAQLERIHPNPYLDEGEVAFRARVAAIEARSADLTDAGFLVAVMDLMGHRDRDGHSGAWAMAQTGERLHAWPVWLWDFPDGLRVVAARDPDRDLIGARLARVGSMEMEAARRTVEPLVPRDNASSLRANLPMYLLLPEVLDELGLREPGGPGLTFELLDGSRRELTTEPLAIEAYRDWIFGEYGGGFPEGLPPDEAGPSHLRHRELSFWSEDLADPPGIYVAYNQVVRTGTDGRAVADLADEIATAASTPSDEPFAIDLRNNGGGDNNTFAALRRAVESMARARSGRVSIIAGRSTFSAAGNFITDLLVRPEAANLRLVGEPPGGGLNIYGDVRVVTLPASGIVVLISTRYHERAPGDDRLLLPPDRPVELTWADYAAGRDPVLEAAFTP
jgi:hypothetical protein